VFYPNLSSTSTSKRSGQFSAEENFRDLSLKNRPYVILSAALSADGKIAAKDGSSKLSSESDLKDLHELRAAMDALMVGVNTVIVDDPLLTNRSGKGRSPIRVVVDSRLRIPLGSRVLQDFSRHPTLVSCCSSASHEKISELK